MVLRGRSLRLKLTAWFVVVFVVLQATLLGAIVYSRRGEIHSSLDDALSRSAEAMVDNLLVAEIGWDSDALAQLVPRGADFVFFAVRDADGELLASSGVLEPDKLRFGEWENVPAGPIGGVHVRLSASAAEELTGDRGELRLVTLPFRRGGEHFFFQAAVRDEALEGLLGPYSDLVLLGIPVGVVAALVAGWVIAGRAVAPIQQLSERARAVSPTNLSERFDVAPADREIERLEQELNSALTRLERGYRAQDQFISNVSHELRTPVAVLLTQAQVAKMGDRSLEKGYEFVDRAELLLKRLGKVVESFLVLARADLTKGPPRETVSIIDVVLGCLHDCKDLAEQSRVRLKSRIAELPESGEEVACVGDADLLQTMLENVVRNAIGHSPQDGKVALEAELVGGRWTIVVRDQGPGIPEEYLGRVFDRFVRVPDGSGRGDGLGLGLAIAHRIAEWHGGSIDAANSPAGGCTFTITLPVASGIAEPAQG